MSVLSILRVNSDVVKTAILYTIPIYIIYHSIKQLKDNVDEYNKKCNFHNKHNCVVMYSKGEGMSGWPPCRDRVRLTIHTFKKYYEPITFFIETAQARLDIAVMNINVEQIIHSIKAALSRGVKVRLILDYHFIKSDSNIQNFEKLGATILHYDHYNTETIMHYKFALKDFDGTDGYCLCGSINWTMASFIENYEDLVITSNQSIVKSFNDYFETGWNYLRELKEITDSMEIIENETL